MATAWTEFARWNCDIGRVLPFYRFGKPTTPDFPLDWEPILPGFENRFHLTSWTIKVSNLVFNIWFLWLLWYISSYCENTFKGFSTSLEQPQLWTRVQTSRPGWTSGMQLSEFRLFASRRNLRFSGNYLKLIRKSESPICTTKTLLSYYLSDRQIATKTRLYMYNR